MIIFSITRGPGPVKKGGRIETGALIRVAAVPSKPLKIVIPYPHFPNLDKRNEEAYGPFRWERSCFADDYVELSGDGPRFVEKTPGLDRTRRWDIRRNP